jgi:hypothetical protein
MVPSLFAILVVLVWVLPMFITLAIYLAPLTKYRLTHTVVYRMTQSYGCLRLALIHICSLFR